MSASKVPVITLLTAILSTSIPCMAQGNWSTAKKEKINGLYYILFPDTKTAIVGTPDSDIATDRQGVIYNGNNNYALKYVDIPEAFAVNGVSYTVTGINKFAFYKSDILLIVVPETVTDIGAYAFGHSTLKSVVIKSHDVNLGESVFRECHNLKNVTLPDGLKRIPGYAFLNTPIQSINIPNSVTEIGECAFYKCSELESIRFPSKIKVLPRSVCAMCPTLNIVQLPEGLIVIGESAFQGCNKLSNINFPSTIRNIDGWAFADCISLRSVHLPGNVKIGEDAFRGTGYKPVRTAAKRSNTPTKPQTTTKKPTTKKRTSIYD